MPRGGSRGGGRPPGKAVRVPVHLLISPELAQKAKDVREDGETMIAFCVAAIEREISARSK